MAPHPLPQVHRQAQAKRHPSQDVDIVRVPLPSPGGCYISDHLAHMSKYDTRRSGRRPSCHFDGWTESITRSTRQCAGHRICATPRFASRRTTPGAPTRRGRARASSATTWRAGGSAPSTTRAGQQLHPYSSHLNLSQQADGRRPKSRRPPDPAEAAQVPLEERRKEGARNPDSNVSVY